MAYVCDAQLTDTMLLAATVRSFSLLYSHTCAMNFTGERRGIFATDKRYLVLLFRLEDQLIRVLPENLDVPVVLYHLTRL